MRPRPTQTPLDRDQIDVGTTPQFPRLSDALEGADYEAVLGAQERRVATEMNQETRNPPNPVPRDPDSPEAALQSEIKDGCRLLNRTGVAVGTLRWDELTVVNCRVCRRTLLGPRSESMRPLLSGKSLPPPVAGRLGEFYVCSKCLDKPTEG